MLEKDKIGFKSMMDTVTTLYQKPNLDKTEMNTVGDDDMSV